MSLSTSPSSLRRHLPAVVVTVVVTGLVALVGAATGAADIPWRALVGAADLTEIQRSVLVDLRLPRVVLGLLVGASLATAGAAYQGTFRNPLADPYLLGVAAGAGLGATTAIVLGLESWWLPVMAFVGGSVAVLVTYSIGRLARSETSAALILAGVTVAAFFTAMQTYVQQRSSDTVREVFSWILGRLTTAGWDEVLLLLPFFLVATAVIVAHRRHLDVLGVGEAEAGALGMDVARVRLTVVLASTVLTSAAVAVSGLIGFVGIIVPHLVRMAVGPSYRLVVPLSIFGGAALLAGADVAARLIVAPAELPVGVVTAFLGAPFFLLLLRTGRAR